MVFEQTQAKCFHMQFSGNPGTGKTLIARLLGRMFKRLGIIHKGHTVEVQRGDLVDTFIGGTIPKTRSAIKKAQGGILFVDEAYRLVNTSSERDFGKEALEEIMSILDEPKKFSGIVIFAGYPKEMKTLIASNPGLERRVPYRFYFDDYSPPEISKIIHKTVTNHGFKLWSSKSESELGQMIDHGLSSPVRSKLNGSLGNILYERLRFFLNERIFCDELERITNTTLMTFTKKEFNRAFQHVKHNFR